MPGGPTQSDGRCRCGECEQCLAPKRKKQKIRKGSDAADRRNSEDISQLLGARRCRCGDPTCPSCAPWVTETVRPGTHPRRTLVDIKIQN